MSDSQLILFKQEGQHVYDYTNVYDPEVDGANPSNSGKVIPAVRSIVIDNRTSNWKVLIVESVHPTTFKCTYRDFPYKVIDKRSMIYNYGNDVFMLYYDDRVTPTRLVVDAKLILFGSNISKYRLVMPNSDGELIPISQAIRQQSNGTSSVISTIEVAEMTDKYVDGIRRCVPCHTSVRLKDNDIITLELYDANSALVAEVELIARRSTILNTLTSSLNPVKGFTASCNQVIGDHWYLYCGQDVNNLSIFPEVKFSDNTSVITPVDNSSCFIYGLGEIDSRNVGDRYPILIKFYINNRYDIAPDASNVEIIGGEKRVMYYQQDVEIIEKPVTDISKISIIPVWMNDKYTLKFFGYSKNRNNVVDLTNYIMTTTNGMPVIKTDVLTLGTFVADSFGGQQNFTISVPIAASNGTTVTHSQQFSIVLKNPDTAPSVGVGREYWYIVDPDSDPQIVYGKDTVDYNRPVIYYNTTSTKHVISTNEFESESDFINAFFRLAVPPTIGDEAIAPTPTHFQIRSDSGVTLTAPIQIDKYSVPFVINNGGVPVTSGTLIMEFLYVVGGSTAILYGVPVTVIQTSNS